MTARFLSNISAKYYKNPSMLSRVIAKNVGEVFFKTQCRNIPTLYAAKDTLINRLSITHECQRQRDRQTDRQRDKQNCS